MFLLDIINEVVLTGPESLGVSNSYQAGIIHLSLEGGEKPHIKSFKHWKLLLLFDSRLQTRLYNTFKM